LNAELVTFITKKMAAGAAEADILRELLTAGWQRPDILTAYMYVVNAALAGYATTPNPVSPAAQVAAVTNMVSAAALHSDTTL
jgi:hypothetical protein